MALPDVTLDGMPVNCDNYHLDVTENAATIPQAPALEARTWTRELVVIDVSMETARAMATALLAEIAP